MKFYKKIKSQGLRLLFFISKDFLFRQLVLCGDKWFSLAKEWLIKFPQIVNQNRRALINWVTCFMTYSRNWYTVTKCDFITLLSKVAQRCDTQPTKLPRWNHCALWCPDLATEFLEVLTKTREAQNKNTKDLKHIEPYYCCLAGGLYYNKYP